MGSFALFNVAAMIIVSKPPEWLRLLAAVLIGFTCIVLAFAHTAAEAHAKAAPTLRGVEPVGVEPCRQRQMRRPS
jgi:peptidoglycan/LPS O-acetylase OafA/YrhL